MKNNILEYTYSTTIRVFYDLNPLYNIVTRNFIYFVLQNDLYVVLHNVCVQYYRPP